MSGDRAILHVDMDAFFASVEVREDPRLRGLPVLVGGAGRRGVVAAASYEARKFGCRSAQPMAVALRLCPQAVVVAPRHELYAAVSRAVFAVFERFSPLVEGLSIDEAFIDLAGTERLWGPPRRAAEALQAAVFEETALTCSVGIAAVKFLAKIASGMHKPNGLTEIAAGRELEFLATLPIGELWGVGPRTQEKLARRGIATVGDLRRLGEATLVEMFGAHGLHMHRLSLGIDERAVVPDRAAKSLGHEDTYAVDVVGVPELRRCLLSQATRVADRLVAQGLRARCVCLKIRDGEFVTETRQCTLPRATDDYREIHGAACRLLEAVDTDGRGFRLTGVSVSQFESPQAEQQQQLDLLAPASEPPPRSAALQAVLSAVRERHGHQALFPAEAGSERRPGTTGAITHSRPSEPPKRRR
ncbi:DNA polymerase IV [Nannocystis radixulma]|uniref:DNA polymerase IV n=1 Tax=Nannocystis radixulma TaxID=2995305 RepID=A0ABT5AXY1_9BACT|nr:DNA polymerase IV [Nannocystis radixulma]MDC0666705.1 DNA polymerase IV [Nannocystis radixulma]